MEDEEDNVGWFGNNRLICDVLRDMRNCQKTQNYSCMAGLIEEAQIMANRMESALSDQKDLTNLQEKISKVKKKLQALRDEKINLEKQNPSKKAEDKKE